MYEMSVGFSTKNALAYQKSLTISNTGDFYAKVIVNDFLLLNVVTVNALAYQKSLTIFNTGGFYAKVIVNDVLLRENPIYLRVVTSRFPHMSTFGK